VPTLARIALVALVGAPWTGPAFADGAGRPTPSGPAAAQIAPRLPDPPSAADVARRAAIERGLAWLARAQGHDGSFPKPTGPEAQHAPIGIAALGALAFLAGGSSPGRGPYGRETQALVEYLLNHVDLAPKSPRYGYCSEQGDPMSRMHGHGFATLALAEAFGMGPPDPRLERALVAAVGCIERSQSPEGGWYYEPRPVGHEGSVTICLVQALRAAKNAGIRVDPAVVHRAEEYVLALRNEQGLFRYQLGSDASSIALTAAAIATLNAAGTYDDRVIKDAVDVVWRELVNRDDRESEKFPYYERLYLAQAFYQLADRSHFERWFATESERVLAAQTAEGNWRDATYGDAYATASTVLVLALPDGLLPIFQR
jgi:hypothetical protein